MSFCSRSRPQGKHSIATFFASQGGVRLRGRPEVRSLHLPHEAVCIDGKTKAPNWEAQRGTPENAFLALLPSQTHNTFMPDLI
eukprot:1159760-Pelagomonas_calceolata.AAC.5